MNSGEVQATLNVLNETAKLSYVDELIDRKQTSAEKCVLEATDIDFYRSEYDRLTIELETACEQSKLTQAPSARAALNDLLVRLRMKEGRSV